MELYESIRNQQEYIISRNPTTIVITRSIKTDDGAGGYITDTIILDPQDIRIYNKSNAYIKIINVKESGWAVKRTQKAIALYNADVLGESATNLDTFICGINTYKIVDVKDITTQGQVCFKELEIEIIA
jgi:hypothetical protein